MIFKEKKLYEQKKQAYLKVPVYQIEVVYTLSNVDLLEGGGRQERDGSRQRLRLRARAC